MSQAMTSQLSDPVASNPVWKQAYQENSRKKIMPAGKTPVTPFILSRFQTSEKNSLRIVPRWKIAYPGVKF